jgi:methylaspartate ammonia-lyase
MSEASNRVKIKYGLRTDPTDAQIDQWRQITQIVTSRGFSLEIAADAAAKQVFPDYRTVVYASEADTIEALLRLIDKRG